MFHSFKNEISGVGLPERFNNPFYYRPHPLCLSAAAEVRDMLSCDSALLAEASKGKMFGVLVVQDSAGNVGYLAAFSGLLFGKNSCDGFVPPVYDMQSPSGYFKQEESRISAINVAIEEISKSNGYSEAAATVACVRKEADEALAALAAAYAKNKEARHRVRANGNVAVEDELAMTRQSQYEKAELKRQRKAWQARIAEKEALLKLYNDKISLLVDERKRRSVALQRWLFEQFRVLNAKREEKSLLALFEERLHALPPAGAGECAAPKLLQYAYMNSLKPLAMAEFWVGESPVGELRRDGCFYGSCKSKCEPILSYMLQGIDVEESALEKGCNIESIEVVYEDDSLLVVNKPAGVLSVPGVVGGTSVQEWLREHHSRGGELYVVHRLDMATSGLLLVAKSMEMFKFLQRQFAEREVKKTYIALLDGVPLPKEGTIELPLAPDYENRPRQKVDFLHGKEAVTCYSVIATVMYAGKECALVRLMPVTGRTHQLRVHAASNAGLDTPIVGDTLYGIADERLMLHAASLEFKHPVTGELMRMEKECEFFCCTHNAIISDK